MSLPYRDMREYLEVLERRGKLRRITREVDKDWEIAAVCRALFTEFSDTSRPAVVFERIRGFDTPTAAGILGASPEIYGLAMETEPQRIAARWEEAMARPIAPTPTSAAPCKERVLLGDDADVTAFPWPIWTVGQDAGPYVTAGCVVTRDVRSGERNVGTYRLQIKGPRKTGLQITAGHDGHRHIRRNEEAGLTTPVAVVVGVDPVVGLCSATNFPQGTDELCVAGGVRREPVEVVRCETVDLEVPAATELVIEGEVRPGERELEGPFGEYSGYMAPAGETFVLHVTAITHRRRPVLQAFISQMPPSESSVIRGLGREQTLLRHLRQTLGLPVTDVHLLPAGGVAAYVAVAIHNPRRLPGLVKEVMFAVWSFEGRQGKILVVVDDDIDIRDPFFLNWALSFRMQPASDLLVIPQAHAVGNDPSTAPADVPHHARERLIGSKVGIDATRKFDYPALAVPPRDHLERVRASWGGYGLA